jgi:hypothetical protein
VPRCIYIDSSKRVVIEYRYEQKSNASRITKWSKKNNKIVFTSLGREFSILNDSIMLLLNYGHEIYFKKISNKVVIGDGVQTIFRQFFWGKNKKWQFETINNGKSIDTIVVSISATKFNIRKNNETYSQYEFTDTKQYNVGNEKLYGIDLFSTNDRNMATSDRIFAIKKSGKRIELYRNDSLSYILNPIE